MVRVKSKFTVLHCPVDIYIALLWHALYSSLRSYNGLDPRSLHLDASYPTLIYQEDDLYASGGGIGNESVPIQLAQCLFTGLAISNAEI